MTVSIVRLGSPRLANEGPRIGTVRFHRATLSHHTNFSVGCYCADESRCHRSILRDLLLAHGAQLG